jgi:hypothetical protein
MTYNTATEIWLLQILDTVKYLAFKMLQKQFFIRGINKINVSSTILFGMEFY